MKIQALQNNKIICPVTDEGSIKINPNDNQLPYYHAKTYTTADSKLCHITLSNLLYPVQLQITNIKTWALMATINGPNKGKCLIKTPLTQKETLTLSFEENEEIVLITTLDKLFQEILAYNPFFCSDSNNKASTSFPFFNPNIYAIENAVHRLLNSNKSGLLQHLFTSSILMEILGYSFESMDITNRSQPPHFDADQQKLYEAKKLILSNLKSTPTIPKLAREIGLNEFKLKQGFKLLFGETIFRYITNQRMELAKTMLQNTNKSMEDIAETIGYGYAHHFATAFKKKFRFSPQQYRKQEQKISC